jgi:glycosyltransferase involved in cell wall biosynthesis
VPPSRGGAGLPAPPRSADDQTNLAALAPGYSRDVRLSAVVPTLNEEAWLPAAVASVREGARGGGAAEVLVADCGSTDRTAEVAGRLGCRLLVDAALDARGPACDAGAAAAAGEVLLFLDADCRLPDGWDVAIESALADPEVVGGGFELRLDGPQRGLRLVEWINRLRYRRSRLFYGDQAVFVRAAAFRAAGGFRGARILESAKLCRRLERLGRLVLLPLPVLASPRRFDEGGLARVFLLDVLLWLTGLLRLPLDRQAGRLYWRSNRHRPVARGESRSERSSQRREP